MASLLALLIGPLLLAVGAHRASAASWWPTVLWVAGLGGFLVSEFTAKVAGLAVACAGLLWAGLAVVRGNRVLEADCSNSVPAGSSLLPERMIRRG
ncbi:MAG: hypothetical protein LC635_02315 [Pseudonocardiaceae bacterium]|nr:hypothetical protein [Pseudonocardiaceae bacterium]